MQTQEQPTTDAAVLAFFGLSPEEQARERGMLDGWAGRTPQPPAEPHLERAYKMAYGEAQAERAEAEAEAWARAW